MNLFIMLCHLISNFVSTNSSAYLHTTHFSYTTLSVITFYGVWNLDYFRGVLPPFCISTAMSTLQVMALDYTVALFPLLLSVILYYCIELHARGCKIMLVLEVLCLEQAIVDNS